MATPSESEWATRKKRINPQLAACGWLVEAFDPHNTPETYTHHALTEFPTANGPADYALIATGQLIGVVEAKKLTLGPQNVLTQAERYGRGLTDSPFDFGRYHFRLLYSTNRQRRCFTHAPPPLGASSLT